MTNVVTESGTVFEGEAEPTELVGVYEVSAEDGLAAGAEGTSPAGSSPSTSRSHAQADPYGENPMKRKLVELYFDFKHRRVHLNFGLFWILERLAAF